MRIFIDADACPVTRIAERIAQKDHIPVTLLCDSNHALSSEYSTIKIIDAGADAVDIALINLCQRGDIVVTQDYGVAALALGKGARAIHQSGRWYTDENMDRLLMERHLAKKARRSAKHHLKGPAKRTEEDDRRFAESFERMIQEAIGTTTEGHGTNMTRSTDPIWGE
ncbi:MAG: YaiI/YqxD family protein [Clostridia bacterium]|nr:YaiI/YqxD family protein [Clostridia bacterium]